MAPEAQPVNELARPPSLTTATSRSNLSGRRWLDAGAWWGRAEMTVAGAPGVRCQGYGVEGVAGPSLQLPMNVRSMAQLRPERAQSPMACMCR